MKKTPLFLFLSSALFLGHAYAQDLSVKYAPEMKAQDKQILEKVIGEVSTYLPPKMKEKMPEGIIIKVAALTKHTSIPAEVCLVKAEKTDDKGAKSKKDKPFVYGQYEQFSNTLTINAPVLAELRDGKDKSKRINCQHKSLYDQAVATLIHEFTHAYDFHNGRVSNTMEYIRRAGFKKGLLKIKNKNVEAMRSADPYELVSIAESFAVNMEYFTMDPEFLCRKPSMFEYFKKQFGIDPFPGRDCSINKTIMLTTMHGFLPTDLDFSRVYRIDYLLASAGKGLQSGFGHTMFRIVMCAPEHFDPISNRTIAATPFGKKCLDDKLYHIVVSYRANVEDATLNYFKGLVGGYPSMLFLLNFSDVLDEYNRDELRDLIAYPLNLTVKEREEFINRVREEHWGYRGSYKFITANCATESYDLLKSALDRSQLDTKSSISPNGVLEDLDQLNFTSMKSSEVEVFPAKTDQILLAYTKAYGYKLKSSEKSNKSAVQKFIDESKAEDRMARFQKFSKTKLQAPDLNTELSMLKDRLVQASSFSVMEQQILRTLALKYRKQAAEMFMNTEDQKIKDMLKETGASFSQSFMDLSKEGYGIPFTTETVSNESLSEKAEAGVEALKKAEAILRDVMPDAFDNLEKINANIKIYNNASLAVRKEFREKLDIYINQVLKNLGSTDTTREVLVKASEGDKSALAKVRELLGKDLVTEKEILDVKLKKLIQETL